MAKVIKMHICARRDTTANWNAHASVIPQLGEIIVYTDYKIEHKDGKDVFVPGIKIGDGKAYVVDLPFVVEASEADEVLRLLEQHEANQKIHTNEVEKTFWNKKLNYVEPQNETLILTIN